LTIAAELTIVCVAYKRYESIPVLIHSLLVQTVKNFKLLILHDAYDEQMDVLLSQYKAQYPAILDYAFTEVRHNDYGHSLREIGIRLTNTPYLLLTNDDNYYCPIFVEKMMQALQTHQADIVLCDMIHSHNNPGGHQQPPYSLLKTAPQPGSVDIGCFIVRTNLAKQVGFRDKGHDGDATFFADILRQNPQIRVAKVNQVLFVHN
jgi:hypothetical protein